MKLVALEIPDDPADLPGWLEGQLLGFDLAALVAELEAVQPPGPKPGATLPKILGGEREAVLDRGLAALPPERLRLLLRRPRLLLDLQELVLVEGGARWQELAARGSDPGPLVEPGWQRLDAFLEGGGADS